MKQVNLPIIVPKGDFCWRYDGTKMICHHFSNEGGHSACGFDFDISKETKEGVHKPQACLDLFTSD